MAINPDKNAVEQGLIARLIGKIKRIALDMGDSVSAETSRAQAAEAAAKTEVVQGENCTIEKTTAADGHDVYTVNADGKPQVQADWNQADSSAVDYVKNRPQNLVQDANYVHTDNNFTTAEKNKLGGIESGAQVNVIEKVKVNGTEQGVTDKAVDISVPTASTATPLKDGTASAGSSSQWARGDHVHPTDDSREAVSNKKQVVNDSSTTEYPSSKAVADFVNSSVATNTANFLGTIAESSLGLDYTATNEQIALALNVHSWESTPTNNDYCFVSVNDPQTTDVDEYRRFKFNGSVWAYEYTLNNSSFTQPQWDAINSGLTSSDRTAYNAAVTLLSAHVGDGSIHVTSSEKNAWNAKQDAISDLATIRSGASAGATALQPSGNGSNLSVTPDGTSTGYDLGSSTTLKAFAQKFKNLVSALKALSFKDKVSDSDINGTISDSHIASASTWNGKQNSLGISASGDTGKFLNERGVFATPNYPSVPSVINNLTSTSTTDALSAAQGKKLNDLMKRSSLPVIDEQITYAYIGCLPRDGMATGAFQSLSLTISYTPSLTNSNSIFSLTANLFFKSNKMIADLSTLYPNTQTPKLYWRYVASPAKMEFYVELPSHTSTWADFDYEASALDFDYTNIGKIASLPADCTLITNTTDKRVGSTSTPVYVKPDGTIDACLTSSMSVGSATTATHLSSNGVCDTWSAGSYDSTKPYAIIAESTYVINRHNGEGSLLQFEMGNDVLVRLKMHFNTNDGSVQIANVVVINSTHTLGWIKDNIRISYFTYTSNNTPYVAIRAYVKFTSDWQCWRARQLDCQSGDLGYENWRQWTFYNKRGSDQTNYVGTLASYSFRTPYTSTAVGSPTIPVYVDSDGQVQPCDPSQMGVGAASYAESVNLSRTLDSTYGDSIRVGTGTAVTISNSGNAKKWDSWRIAVDEFGTSSDTIYFY